MLGQGAIGLTEIEEVLCQPVTREKIKGWGKDIRETN